MTQAEKWALVRKALDEACTALELAGWPQKQRARSRLQHMIGYSRARGRRPIMEEGA